jgi:O-antigen ligase
MWNFKVRDLAVAVAAGAAAFVGYIAAFPASATALWETIVNSDQDESILHRTDSYALVGDTLRAHPVFGLGLGAVDPKEYRILDNEWLQQIVQGGTVGLIAMIVLAAGGIFGISAALRTASTPRERDQAYMIGSIYVGVLSSSVAMDLFAYQQATFVLLISFSLLWSNFKVPLPEARTASPRQHHRVE